MSVSLLHPNFIEAACESQGIKLGGFLTINEDATFRVNTDADDFMEVMSKLTGLIMEKHVIDTMVLPSNAARIRSVAYDVESIMRDSTLTPQERQEAVEEVVETLHGCADNIDPETTR